VIIVEKLQSNLCRDAVTAADAVSHHADGQLNDIE